MAAKFGRITAAIVRLLILLTKFKYLHLTYASCFSKPQGTLSKSKSP